MNAERLAEIRDMLDGPYSEQAANWVCAQMSKVLDHVGELTRQLDDARDKAINAGIFTSSDGEVVRCYLCKALDDANPCRTCEPA